MTTEDDALKTLQNIEKLLKSATVLSGNKPTFSSRAQISQNSQKDRADKEAKKAFKAVASSGKETNDTLLGLNKSLVGLNTEVGSTAKNFSALNTQMEKFMTSLQPIQQQDQPKVSVNDNIQLAKTMGIWGQRTVLAINNVARILGEQNTVQPQKAQSWIAGLFGGPKQQNAISREPQSTAPVQPTPAAPPQSWIARMVSNFGNASIASVGLGVALDNLWQVAVKLSVDYLRLSRIGMGSMQNLKDISVYAIQAGMSLKEYMELTKSSITVMSKAGSLENFNKIISAQDQQLASMGIFGIEARQLQANLAQSSASLGVPLSELTNATASQVSAFDALRKVSRTSADEFSKMVSYVSESAEAQKELLGLAPGERLARMNHLVELQTIGTSLGMTAEASKRLGDALMKQRQATVKERFAQGGALLQLGAITGKGAEGRRAYELNMKGRRRSKAEDDEFFALVQSMDKTAQAMYEVGGPGMQNVLEQIDEATNKGSLGDIIKEGRGVSLAKDAGPQSQEAFGKHVSVFGEFVGKLTAFSEGIGNSVLGPLMAGVGAGLLAVFRGPIAATLGATISGISAGASAGSAAKGIPAMQTLRGFNFTQILGKLPFIGNLISAGMELFTGEISNALNPNGGWIDRISGVFIAFVGAIPQMIIDGLSFVFGDAFMKPIQSLFDVIKTGVAGAVNGILRVLTGIVGFFTDFLPEDSALRTMVRSANDNLDASITANANTIDALGGFLGTDRKTLKELSAQHTKSAKDATDNTKTVSKAVENAQNKFNNVISASSISSGEIIQDAKTLVGSPQVQVPKTVTPVAVNTPETTNTPVKENAEASTNPEVLATLQAMLQILRESLMLEGRQVEHSEALLRLARPTTRFQSGEQVADKLLKRGQ